MDISHKIPKGLFQHTGLWHGITLGQMFMLAGFFMFEFFIVIATGGITKAKMVASLAIMGGAFFLMKMSNMKSKGIFKEYITFIVKYPFEPKRYSG